MATGGPSLELAQQHLQAGRLPEAEKVLRDLVVMQPTRGEAWHMLGAIAQQSGRSPAAILLISRAIALIPFQPDALSNLGTALKACGRLEDAIQAYRYALILNPRMPQAQFNLGNALRAAGRTLEAAVSFQQALIGMPESVAVHEQFAQTLQDLGRTDDAVTVLSQGIVLKAGLKESHYGTDGGARIDSQLAEAECLMRQALALRPEHVEANFKLAGLLHMRGKEEEALEAYRRVLCLQPAHTTALSNLGAALRKLGRLDEGFEVYGWAVAINPDNADAHYNYGNGLQARGRVLDAVAAFRRALAIRPQMQQAHANMLAALNYTNTISRAEVYAEHRRYEQQFAVALAADIRSHLQDRSPDRTLRIGYVSPDFWRHSCAHYVLPLFAGHDHNRYQIICYSDVRQPDSFTRRLQACADLWHDTYGLKDEALVELIRCDEVDILVDLNGHFAGTRLLAFARKPAPVQVTWLGYPNTTGLTTIDYRLVDPVTDPPGEADAYHSEALVRLSTGFLCYTPVPEAPEPAPAPCLEKGYVTFGSFNNMAKVTPEVIALWAAILQRVPTARLVLKSRQLDDAGTRRRFAALLHAHGIAEERFDLLPWSLRPDDHMGAYHGLDIALDPFPYNGTTTTCEALWMGVPVLSLMGDRHAGRVGASLLTTLGLSDWIATDPADYVDRAARLAADPAGLAELHRTLRARLVDSPLFNAAAFARMVEAAYRAMWQRWCAGQAPAPFILTPGP